MSTGGDPVQSSPAKAELTNANLMKMLAGAETFVSLDAQALTVMQRRGPPAGLLA